MNKTAVAAIVVIGIAVLAGFLVVNMMTEEAPTETDEATQQELQESMDALEMTEELEEIQLSNLTVEEEL